MKWFDFITQHTHGCWPALRGCPALAEPHLAIMSSTAQYPGQQGAVQGRGLAQDALHPTVCLRMAWGGWFSGRALASGGSTSKLMENQQAQQAHW